MPDDSQILTLAEVAQYLKVAEKTIRRMVQRDEIPCVKVGRQWRFVRSAVDGWLAAHTHLPPQDDLGRLIESGVGSIPLSRLICPGHVIMEVKPGSRRAILRQLVRPLVADGTIGAEGELLGRLLRREGIVSTAVGLGVAFPHVRDPVDSPIRGPHLVVGISRPGLDYGASDGARTHLLCLLCTDSEVVHVRVLARLAGLVRETDFVPAVLRAGDPAAVVSRFIAADQEHVLRGAL